MLTFSPTTYTTKNKSAGTSITLDTVVMLHDGADLVKANLFFEECGAQLKGKVYEEFIL